MAESKIYFDSFLGNFGKKKKIYNGLYFPDLKTYLIMSFEKSQQEFEYGFHIRRQSLIDFFTSLILFKCLKYSNILNQTEHYKHDEFTLRVPFRTQSF